MASTPSPGGCETLPSSPSSTGAQNAKAKRYDRQLRLWGDHGQNALEKARVCLIGATATSTEILKSLVLPGVGNFTIVDGKRVTPEDIGNNFFLDNECVNQSRGSVATRLLLELNPEVTGDCVDESVEQVLSNRPDFFSNFDLVIVTEISEKTLITLSNLLWNDSERPVPMMVVKTYGLLGYIRLQVKEHTIIESHPDNELKDLRLDMPFSELVEFMDSQQLENMSKNEYMHVPYVVIIYKYLEEWKKSHDGNLPQNFKEKREFRDIIKKTMKSREDVENEELENFDEAMKAVITALEPTKVPSKTQKIISDQSCISLHKKSSDFWVMARGLKDFIDEKKILPVRGSIPDMFSDSDRYIKLSNIYRNKAIQDAEIVHRFVQHHLESIGRPSDSISEASVRKFCKEASNLILHQDSGSIADEFSGNISPTTCDLYNTLEQNPDSEVTYYLILRAVDRFQTDFNVLPGGDDYQFEADIGRLKTCMSNIMSECYKGISTSLIKDDYVHEVCRYGAAEPHAMAALIGGCAAHEAIKLLTKQYVPVDNLFLFNSMTMNTVTLKIA